MRRATAAISALGSIASTFGPRAANRTVALPVPAPTSRTASPSRTRASSSTSSTSCSGYVGRLASYSSATSPNTSRLRVVAISSSLAAVSPSRRDPPLGSTSLTGAMARVTRTAAQVACALTVAVMLIPGSPARAGVMRIGRRPVVPVGAVAKGAVAPRLRLHVTVTLKPRNPAALNAYAEAVSTPGSRSYRHYLTPSQFGRRFGATAADVGAVRRGLRAQGLDPGSVTPGSLSIPVFATAARLERALRISLRRLALPGRRTAVAANAAPAVQASAAGAVQAVVGLDTVSAPHPLLARPASSVASSAGSASVTAGRPSGHRRERPSRHRLDRPSPPERTSPRPAPTHAPRPRARPPRSTPTRRTRSPRRTDSTASMTRATSGAA